jgi:hypothetical protein
MAPDRLLERLSGLEVAAGERPASGKRLASALPEQDLQSPGSDLQDDRDGDL